MIKHFITFLWMTISLSVGFSIIAAPASSPIPANTALQTKSAHLQTAPVPAIEDSTTATSSSTQAITTNTDSSVINISASGNETWVQVIELPLGKKPTINISKTMKNPTAISTKTVQLKDKNGNKHLYEVIQYAPQEKPLSFKKAKKIAMNFQAQQNHIMSVIENQEQTMDAQITQMNAQMAAMTQQLTGIEPVIIVQQPPKRMIWWKYWLRKWSN
jgi:hypothetical protein